jgi:hypothetical protein
MTEYILANQEVWQMIVRVSVLYVFIYLIGISFNILRTMLFLKNLPVEKMVDNKLKKFVSEVAKFILLSWFYYVGYSKRNEEAKALFKEWR